MSVLICYMRIHLCAVFQCSSIYVSARCFLFFFFNDTATTEIYTLSLHDALPIYVGARPTRRGARHRHGVHRQPRCVVDRKSTRLNSSHRCISYAVFCLKKKKKNNKENKYMYCNPFTAYTTNHYTPTVDRRS